MSNKHYESVAVKGVAVRYYSLDKPTSFSGEPEDDRFSVDLILPKDHPAVADIRDAEEKIIQGIMAEEGLKKAPKYRSVLMDGDEINETREDNGKDPDPVWQDAYRLRAKNRTRPRLWDGDGDPITSVADTYPEFNAGYAVDAALTLGHYKMSSRGINAYLNEVRVYDDKVVDIQLPEGSGRKSLLV